MLLVDTSVWVDHLNKGLPQLASALREEMVLGHPFVLGEIACGNLQNRREVLLLLSRLPQSPKAGDNEVMRMIEVKKLGGRGLGWVDMHLLASCLIGKSRLWTFDRRLESVANEMKLGYPVRK